MDGSTGPVAGSIEGNVSCLSGAADRRSERLALLHCGVIGIPRPIVGVIHACDEALPSVDFDLAWPVQVEAIDSRAASQGLASRPFALRIVGCNLRYGGEGPI